MHSELDMHVELMTNSTLNDDVILQLRHSVSLLQLRQGDRHLKQIFDPS